MISYDGEKLKMSGDFLEVSAEVGTIVACFMGNKYPNFVTRTFTRSIIASLSSGMFTNDEMYMLLRNEHFNAGIEETIKTIEALRELAQAILTSKQKG